MASLEHTGPYRTPINPEGPRKAQSHTVAEQDDGKQLAWDSRVPDDVETSFMFLLYLIYGQGVVNKRETWDRLSEPP